MKIAILILRILAGVLFLATGIFHFMNYEVMAVYVPLPVGSKYFVLLIASIISISSILVMLGKYVRESFFTIAITFAITGLMILIPTIHYSNDQYLKLIQIPNLYKVVIATVMFIALIASKPKGN
ncbi:MAG: hypothetical protein CFE21_01820 [Bacteroidetes bacterium B1(2017)]|nr:MAG: hypothetical protein CFE21_01820 [Bacteroidetes bacterium B1(2017)]